MFSVHVSGIKHISILFKLFYLWLKEHFTSSLTPKIKKYGLKL